MTDDIVTRLYDLCICCRCGCEQSCTDCEAADEIELLREWKELAYEMRNKYWWCMRRKTLEKFDFMHKADWKRHEKH